MTVVVVLLLAVVGTAGAFAYRTLVGSPRSGEPPIIKADAGPNKIIPPGQGTDNANKQIYDRVGDKNAERVVSREEQPVDVNARTSPRVVFPPLTQNNNPPTVASASPTVRPTGAGMGNGTLGGEEPRKIRTLSIRPGEQDTASAAAPLRCLRHEATPPAPQRVLGTGYDCLDARVERAGFACSAGTAVSDGAQKQGGLAEPVSRRCRPGPMFRCPRRRPRPMLKPRSRLCRPSTPESWFVQERDGSAGGSGPERGLLPGHGWAFWDRPRRPRSSVPA